MNRKNFFKKLGLGAAGIVMSPAILEVLDKVKPAEVVVIPRHHGMTFYADGLQREINQRYLDFTRQIERQMLYGRQWTPEQVEHLTKTKKQPYNLTRRQ